MKNTAILALIGFGLLSSFSQAEEVATVPEGYVTVTVAGSPNGTAYAVTPFSAPLYGIVNIEGQVAGRIGGVTSNTISNSTAGWTVNALSSASSPFFIKITSGAAAGRLFVITANTATALTANTQGLDLTTQNILTGAQGDTYEIVPGDTLLSLLGTTTQGVIGGSLTQFNAGQTDKVLINDTNGVARFYYFDTGASAWRRVGSATDQGNLLVSPKAGFVYYRISTTPLALTCTGKVPSTDSKRQIPDTGTTIMAPYYPVDTTLNGLGIHLISGWRKLNDPGVVLNTTDRLVVKDAANVIRSYYHDGVSWKRVGSASNQDSVPVLVGASVYCTRFGSGSQTQTWTQTLPYSLN